MAWREAHARERGIRITHGLSGTVIDNGKVQYPLKTNQPVDRMKHCYLVSSIISVCSVCVWDMGTGSKHSIVRLCYILVHLMVM